LAKCRNLLFGLHTANVASILKNEKQISCKGPFSGVAVESPSLKRKRAREAAR